MIRITKSSNVFCVVWLVCLWPMLAYSDHDLDMEYAELQPLAEHSMLLDITRVDDTLVAVGERGHIVRSTDGETWVQAEVVPTRSTLTTVFSTHGRLWAGGHDTAILTSGDKGKTWTRQFYDIHRQQAIMDIYFEDESIGVAIGSYGLYLRTRDGGHTWHEAKVDPVEEFHLNSLLVLADDKWMIAGEAGLSYRSYDGGETWEMMDLPYQGSMWGALQIDEKCVLFYGLRGHIMESCDFGTTWTELERGSDSSISGAAEFEGLVMFAANSGIVMTRHDGGSLKAHHHSSGVDFSAALSLGDGNFLLVGEEGVHSFPETEIVGQDHD